MVGEKSPLHSLTDSVILVPPGSGRSNATIPVHMKAAVYTKARLGKVLEMKDLEQPVPKDNEVVIRVRAASVNPLDWRMKSQRPGVDVAGQVAAVGGTVTQFKPGDAVFGICKGAFAEYATQAAFWTSDNSASACNHFADQPDAIARSVPR